MKKSILLGSLVAAGLALCSASAAEFMTFRVCEDQHVLRTSDGAEAGHVEYIVYDPGEQRVVSTVITGGVVADRHVAIPISAMHFGAEREVTLTKITREQIVSAPVIETSRFTARGGFEPSYFEKSYTHFGYDPAEITRTSSRTSVDVNSTDRNVSREGRDTIGGARENTSTVTGDASISGRDASRPGEAAARNNREGAAAAGSAARSTARAGADSARSATETGRDAAGTAAQAGKNATGAAAQTGKDATGAGAREGREAARAAHEGATGAATDHNNKNNSKSAEGTPASDHPADRATGSAPAGHESAAGANHKGEEAIGGSGSATRHNEAGAAAGSSTSPAATEKKGGEAHGAAATKEGHGAAASGKSGSAGSAAKPERPDAQ